VVFFLSQQEHSEFSECLYYENNRVKYMETINIHKLIKERWSPRSFIEKQISNDEMSTLIEAARWAPSARNSQPWRYIIALKEDTTTWERLFDCLVDFNKEWVKNASAIVLAVVQKKSSSGNILPHAWYDLGLSVANLTFQANSLGIYVRNMGGFSPTKAIDNFSITENFEPVVMLALGYPGNFDKLEPGLVVPRGNERERRKFDGIVYNGDWKLLE
jgi:nitroreductase